MGKSKRRTTAEDILEVVSPELHELKQYFGTDISLLIYKVRVAQGKSPQTICSLLGTEHPLDRKVCQVFCARSSAIKEEQSLGNKSRGHSQTVLHPNYTGGGRDLLRQQGLADSHHSLNELKQGRKLFRIEKGVGRPGISSVLSPAYSKLQHLPLSEERRLIQLLNTGGLPEFLILADDLSPTQYLYQSWYDNNQVPFKV
ncbi:hypothetical protein BDW59DRAFT_155429 [Aspergillus cavernicola]|uniref:Uncharacterized protein n=1 Tax=Aspergillus cavernicola TaxID=176166 RepID=A0ABR4H8P9_9EURO